MSNKGDFGSLEKIYSHNVKWQILSCFIMTNHQYVIAIECLGSLVVMTLTQLARGRGSTPRWGTEFFQIANGHFDPLLHVYQYHVI